MSFLSINDTSRMTRHSTITIQDKCLLLVTRRLSHVNRTQYNTNMITINLRGVLRRLLLMNTNFLQRHMVRVTRMRGLNINDQRSNPLTRRITSTFTCNIRISHQVRLRRIRTRIRTSRVNRQVNINLRLRTPTHLFKTNPNRRHHDRRSGWYLARVEFIFSGGSMSTNYPQQQQPSDPSKSQFYPNQSNQIQYEPTRQQATAS